MKPIIFRGCNVLLVGEHIPNCADIVALRTGDGRIVTAWKPDEEELAKLAAGALVTLHVFGSAFQPVALTVGDLEEDPAQAALRRLTEIPR